MIKLYAIILSLSCLLFAHHDDALDHGGGSVGGESTDIISEICSNDALFLDPHYYAYCLPKHALSLEEIGKISDINQRFKEMIKRESLVPGTALYSVVQHRKANPDTIIEMCETISTRVGSEAFRRILIQELESGNGLDATKLGISEEVAAEIMVVASQPEIAVPLLAAALIGLGIFQELHQFLIDSCKSSEHPVAVETINADSKEFFEYVMRNGDYIKTEDIAEGDNRFRATMQVSVPLTCRFPIIKNKLYLVNYTREDLENTTLVEVLDYLKTTNLFDKALDNIMPQLDDGQYCDYLRDRDKAAPFKPVTDITDQTKRQNRFFAVLRTFTFTADNSAPDTPLNIQFQDDELSTEAPSTVPRNPLNRMGTSIRKSTSFWYRSSGNLDFIETERASIETKVRSKLDNSKILQTISHALFYLHPNANPPFLRDTTYGFPTQNGILDYISNVDQIDDATYMGGLRVVDILDWGTIDANLYPRLSIPSVKIDDRVLRPNLSLVNSLANTREEADSSFFLQRLQQFFDVPAISSEQLKLLLVATASEDPTTIGRFPLVVPRSPFRLKYYPARAWGQLNFSDLLKTFNAYKQSLNQGQTTFRLSGPLSARFYTDLVADETKSLNSFAYEPSIPLLPGPSNAMTILNQPLFTGDGTKYIDTVQVHLNEYPSMLNFIVSVKIQNSETGNNVIISEKEISLLGQNGSRQEDIKLPYTAQVNAHDKIIIQLYKTVSGTTETSEVVKALSRIEVKMLRRADTTSGIITE